MFLVVGRVLGGKGAPVGPEISRFIHVGLPVFAVVMTALAAVLSLVTIISIYREGGILKRLRATPLRPQTILTAHVLVKLLLTAVTLIAMVAAGKRYYPVGLDVPVVSFTMALLISTVSILSIGFVIKASIVPISGALCPADWCGDSLSDARVLGAVLPPGGTATFPADRRASAAAHLRGLVAAGDLAARPLVSPLARSWRA